MRLIYLPCEMYSSRWTDVVSGPNGMFERKVKDYNIELITIRPDNEVREIRSGVVLNTVERCKWGFAQVTKLVEMLFAKEVNDTDVIYCEDFWIPGMEMIPYAMSLAHCYPKIFSFCHAQSVDPHDFTHSMATWMRGFEQAWAQCQDGIFTAAPELVHMLTNASIQPKQNFYYNKGNFAISVGTVFDSRVLFEIESETARNSLPTKRVVFTSRWDREKNPQFFCELAQEVLSERNDISFLVLTGLSELQSNDRSLLTLAYGMKENFSRFFIYTDLSKKEYYQLLGKASVQFNCSDQDFVSYCLLEAAVYGAHPLHPNYLTFPGALHHSEKNLYEKGDLQSAKEKLYFLFDDDDRDYRWVYQKYERSVARMLEAMGFPVPHQLSLESLLELSVDEVKSRFNGE
jgi:glycosyltransferase involved in cell wall biosynthesis